MDAIKTLNNRLNLPKTELMHVETDLKHFAFLIANTMNR